METFDLSCITLAFNTADAAEAAFDILKGEMVQWHESGEYPERADVIVAIVASGRKESTAKVYASRILAWAKAGKLPKTMHEMVNDGPKVTGKGGRPKGQGKGESTKADKPDTAKADAPSVPNEDGSWKTFIETMRAQVPGRKNWASEDIVAFQDCASKMLALLTRNRSK
jgi:hypothetical protein